MVTGCKLPAVVTGLFFGQSEQLALIPFASLGHLRHNTRSHWSGLTLSSPVKSMKLDPNRTMASNRVTWLSIGATITLSLWAGWMLAAETRDHLTRCKLGPEPPACELRLLGR